MLDVVFIALMQAVVGPPDTAPPTEPAAVEQPVTPEAAPAPAEPVAEAAAPAEVAPAAAEPVRCRNIRITGSRFLSRVCSTARQDEERRQQAHDSLDSIRNTTQQPPG